MNYLHRSEELQTYQDQEDDKARLKRFYKIPLKSSDDSPSPQKQIPMELDISLNYPIERNYEVKIAHLVLPQVKNLSYHKYLKQNQLEQNHKRVNDFAFCNKPKIAQSNTNCFCFL